MREKDRLMLRRSWMLPCALAFAWPGLAAADDFAAGSLIVPMDTDYQDMGMLKAYGLVYELLHQGVPVRWVIKTGKKFGDADFTASAVDLVSDKAVAAHPYRGGPWVIDAADADAALPVIDAWQKAHPETTVHEATAAFTGDVARLLVVAPTIAMMADGNQKIARKYMQAAGIPDSVGDPLWPDTSPDMLDPKELSGPSADNHHDGALFDADGDPIYCQFMSMHWAVKDAQQNPEVVAEMREFLTFPTHFFAECQAVNAFENLAPWGYYLTQKGFMIGTQPKTYDYYQTDTAFAQLDGPFLSVGGSEPAYTLQPGDAYKASDIVMITAAGTPIGVNDVWMTGFLDGICPADSNGCLTAGKVSYLGGHEYDVDLPISTHPSTQGTRLFLNSLFEAPCATAEGLPDIVLTKTAPAVADAASVDFTVDYVNQGATPALDAVLTDELPPGVTFVSATNDGSFAAGVVTWQLGNLGAGENGSVGVTVTLDAPGIYENMARLEYRAGVNTLQAASNLTMTAFGVDPGMTSGPGDSTGGESGTGGQETGSPGSDTGGTPTGETPTGGPGTGDAGTDGAPTGGGGTGATTGGGASAGSTSTGGASGGLTAGDGTDSGCGCRGGAGDPAGVGLLLGAWALRRRRRDARA